MVKARVELAFRPASMPIKICPGLQPRKHRERPKTFPSKCRAERGAEAPLNLLGCPDPYQRSFRQRITEKLHRPPAHYAVNLAKHFRRHFRLCRESCA